MKTIDRTYPLHAGCLAHMVLALDELLRDQIPDPAHRTQVSWLFITVELKQTSQARVKSCPTLGPLCQLARPVIRRLVDRYSRTVDINARVAWVRRLRCSMDSWVPETESRDSTPHDPLRHLYLPAGTTRADICRHLTLLQLTSRPLEDQTELERTAKRLARKAWVEGFAEWKGEVGPDGRLPWVSLRGDREQGWSLQASRVLQSRGLTHSSDKEVA